MPVAEEIAGEAAVVAAVGEGEAGDRDGGDLRSRIEHPIERGFVHFAESHALVADPGVVDQDIEPGERRQRRAEQRRNVLLYGDIG